MCFKFLISQLFSDEVAIEDPDAMKNILTNLIQQNQKDSGGMRKQKDNKAILLAAGRVMEVCAYILCIVWI